jgi:DNA invertase Pin-like site-specific DNA recombinase
MDKRAALYLRVSTDGQTTDNQRMVLEEVARRSDWEIVGVYDDNGVSGAKERSLRPEFDRLCKDATRRQFDVIMAWSVDRLGRSLQDLVAFLGDLHAVGVDLFMHQQGVDTTTPAGKAMFQMMGVFAEFERSMIQERVKAGLARAKANGKRLGRPNVADGVRDQVLAAKENGLSVRRIAQEARVSVGTVHGIIKSAAWPSGAQILPESNGTET